MDTAELAGKRALVTGGTEGIGAATVARLSAAGAQVATTARANRPSQMATSHRSNGSYRFSRRRWVTPRRRRRSRPTARGSRTKLGRGEFA